jgi:hypothetical protein
VRQAVLLVILLLMPCFFGFTQSSDAARNGRGGDSPESDAQFGQRRNEVSPAEKRLEHEHEKQMARERQAAIQRDTDKLLALATELKQYVDKSNEHILSLDVMKKAEEIEKLARQVKEKTKISR